MNKQLVLKGFVYQIVMDGNSILVIDNKEDAEKYIKTMHARGASIYLLPIAVFTYKEGEE